MKTIQRAKPIVVFAVLACMLSLTACSSLQIFTQKYKQSIIDSRVNIITSNRLSNHSLYLLESADLDEKVCFGNLQNCLSQLEK